MQRQHFTARQMVFPALMAALLSILSPLSLPIGPIHISLATLVVCLTAWTLGCKRALLSVSLYLFLGAIGLPVYSGYQAGLGALSGPSGGYLVGYLFIAWLGGLAVEKSGGRVLPSAFGFLLGHTACYACGTIWFRFQAACSLQQALLICVLPFLPFDLIKILLACSVGPLLRKRLAQASLL